jgi:hypothetical protein
MNSKVLFVRVMGRLVPISEVSLVQVCPNNRNKIVSEVPLARPLADLMRHNLTSMVKAHTERDEWLKELDGENIGTPPRS